jgi:hypothetical protein
MNSEDKMADMVLTNAKVITVDKEFSIKEAAAFE